MSEPGRFKRLDMREQQIEHARRLIATGVKTLMHWTDGDAVVWQVDELANLWAAVGRPEEIVNLIITKGEPNGPRAD